MERLHADELAADVPLVQALLRSQFPQYASWRVSRLADFGSSHVLFALDRADGSERLVIRMPRQPGGSATVHKEADWLPWVGDHLAVPTPAVVGVGEPGLGYPEAWSIMSWLHGRRADGLGGLRLAEDLAEFVSQLRATTVPAAATTDERLRWYRGDSLTTLDEDFQEAAAACRTLPIALDIDRALAVWSEAVAAAATRTAEKTWYHGDLLVENLLVDEQGELAGVLDFGGLGVGDPTIDLIVAWEALDRSARLAFWNALDVDDAQIAVSRGWALLIAFLTFPYYGATMPRRCADRLVMAQAAIEGD
ncbi:phosphotransferase [Branchiibius sp. NY16-3462-2]|uniref:phosphotransferase n=1 Tax=Branchiibius sp. NY16-3462-2 TaxID=1807500 RepID=UPI000791DA44|nr:phosphotransferase [Branchiibius sp. NY16-3462-2]KYH43736.1 hypothetical protein AZH51_02765 [Branchiibius sp. NY16-3462-2]